MHSTCNNGVWKDLYFVSKVKNATDWRRPIATNNWKGKRNGDSSRSSSEQLETQFFWIQSLSHIQKQNSAETYFIRADNGVFNGSEHQLCPIYLPSSRLVLTLLQVSLDGHLYPMSQKVGRWNQEYTLTVRKNEVPPEVAEGAQKTSKTLQVVSADSHSAELDGHESDQTN